MVLSSRERSRPVFGDFNRSWRATMVTVSPLKGFPAIICPAPLLLKRDDALSLKLECSLRDSKVSSYSAPPVLMVSCQEHYHPTIIILIIWHLRSKEWFSSCHKYVNFNYKSIFHSSCCTLMIFWSGHSDEGAVQVDDDCCLCLFPVRLLRYKDYNYNLIGATMFEQKRPETRNTPVWF